MLSHVLCLFILTQTRMDSLSASSTWQMKQMASEVAWLRSHNYDMIGPHCDLRLLVQSSTTFGQEYYFMSFMSKLTTKHKQPSLGKHTHSSRLGQVKGNLLMPMPLEVFVAEQVVEEMGMGTAWYGQERGSGMLVKSCGG